MKTRTDRLVARLQRTVMDLRAYGYTPDAIQGWVNDVLGFDYQPNKPGRDRLTDDQTLQRKDEP